MRRNGKGEGLVRILVIGAAAAGASFLLLSIVAAAMVETWERGWFPVVALASLGILALVIAIEALTDRPDDVG